MAWPTRRAISLPWPWSTIEGCDFAGIFVSDRGQVGTPYATDPIVIELDTLQRADGEGPCLDALRDEAVFYAEDLGDDVRWPTFGPEAVAARGPEHPGPTALGQQRTRARSTSMPVTRMRSE